MTAIEALRLLDSTHFHNPSARSKVNPSFSCGEIHKIIRDGIAAIQARSGVRPLTQLMEKRVYQCLWNQRSPRYRRNTT